MGYKAMARASNGLVRYNISFYMTKKTRANQDALLIVGAGLSSDPAKLPMDNDFLFKTFYDGNKCTTPPFLEMAFNRLYSSIALDQVTVFEHSSEFLEEKLETVWSELYSNRDNPKFRFKTGLDRDQGKKAHEIDKIKTELVRLAKTESDKDYRYYYHHLFEAKDNKSPYKMLFMFAGWELRKAILEVYGKVRYKDLSDASKSCYQKLLARVFKAASYKQIVSLNYDVILDEAADHGSGKHYVGIDDTGSGEIEIIKPHGSVNWYETEFEHVIHKDSPVNVDEIGFKNNHLYWHSIIPPLDEKYGKSHDQEGILERIYVNGLTHLTRSALLNADNITIIGYSFPIGDQHIRSLMFDVKKERLQNKKPCKTVRYIDPVLDANNAKTPNQVDDAKFTIKQLFYSDEFIGSSQKWVDWVGQPKESSF